MTELINKEELMRRFKPFGREIPKEQVMAVLARIDEGIVRCKDCKHRYTFATNETGTATHYYVCDFMDAQYEDDGYCHHGERSEEIQGLEYAESILDSILREQEEREE